MAEHEPRISVVAPTHQRRQSLPSFVAAILQDPAVSELVLAVDGSTDGSVDWLAAQADADPRIVVLDLSNRGAGAARQAGIEAARGDVVLLLDDDVIAAPDLVTRHAAHHRGGERKLVLGYMPNDWTSLPPDRRAIGRLYRNAYERQCAHYARDSYFVLHELWGGNFSLPREDFIAIGFDQSALGRGEEDREFGIRCLKSGVAGCFDRSLLATHEYSRSLAQFRRDCRMAGESRRLTHEKHADVLGKDLAIGRTLPRTVRYLLPYLAREPLFAPLSAMLTGLFHVGVRLRWLCLETFAARGLGSLETQRGALEAPREP
jgi:glycosyltransferase involved in cell wall biosynthesis